ncbi:MAG: hypothetical protein CSB22_00625 [Deltaproteobacteria bacterium]|nr:MAG: hypothetical protein CSB22_00625 [Deltaproteobacteria bacterium]
MLQLRYPYDLMDNFPEPPSSQDAYKESNIARTGHHNDCFLANVTDEGTYDPEEKLEEFKKYLEKSTLYTATGGETCQATPEQHRTDCQTALNEMEQFHWSYLNYDFYAPDITRWKDEGCYNEISKRLGYRYRLLSTTWEKNIGPDRLLNMACVLTNDGFANLYNKRPLELILRHTSSGNIAEKGTYETFLNLPDDDPELSRHPEYSIRLANKGVWKTESGYNSLGVFVKLK